MGKTYYIAAIELSSSKISGAVGVETFEGIKILATASMPVNGFITKGVVRNVDETSKAITGIINVLEHNLGDKYKVSIKRAYTSLAGLSLHSVKSKVTKGFEDYTRISSGIIDELADENDKTFQCPAGYARVRTIHQEYKLDGKIENNPVGASARIIEGNYLNLIIKEQYLKQMKESFAEAELDIEDSFSAARIDGDTLLDKDMQRNGCALVNIGADTTTISIYTKGTLRMLNVLPLGCSNITKDLCAEHISYDEAEEILITRGYKPSGNETAAAVDSAITNSIIYARMSEILQNVKFRIEESGEHVHHIIFTGGGSKLKNLDLMLKELLPNFKTEIISEPQFNLISDSGVNVSGVTATLYGLLRQGKVNCCEEEVKTTPVITEQAMFTNDELDFQEEKTQEEQEPEISREEKKRLEREEREKQKEEERVRKEAIRAQKQKEKEERKKNKKPNPVVSLFRDWFENATGEEENENDND